VTDHACVEKSALAAMLVGWAPPTFRFAYGTTDSFRKESPVKRQGRGKMYGAYNWKT
jgi:hypothetical protein